MRPMEHERQAERPPAHVRGRVFFARCDRQLLKLEQSFVALAAIVVVLMATILVCGVFLRSQSPELYSFATELGGPAMWPLTYLAAAYIWRTSGHVQFDWLLLRMKGRARDALDLSASIVSGILVALLAVKGWTSFSFYHASGAGTFTLGIPYWYFFWTAGAGLTLFFVELLFSSGRHAIALIWPVDGAAAQLSSY